MAEIGREHPGAHEREACEDRPGNEKVGLGVVSVNEN
jgi:hypothetical protein